MRGLNPKEPTSEVRHALSASAVALKKSLAADIVVIGAPMGGKTLIIASSRSGLYGPRMPLAVIEFSGTSGPRIGNSPENREQSIEMAERDALRLFAA